ncbi:MAG: sugar phosphate isomerase/epimerase [Candidatus Bathyarchaeia archaeon]
MKLGAMNAPFLDILAEISLFGKMGFEFLDLTIEAPKAKPEALLAKRTAILDLLSVYGMGIVGHMPWFFEISHPYDSIRRAFLREGVKVLRTCAKLNASKATVHVESHPSLWPTGFRRRFIDVQISSVAHLAKEAKSLGITLCVENITDRSMRLEEFKHLFLEVPDAMFHLDVAHAALEGGGEKRALKFMKVFKDRLVHVHMSDNRCGEEDLHLPIGAGRIDWEKVVKGLKEIRYDGTITLEIHSPEREYLRFSKEKIQRLWQEG